jgi:hypothetical protein
MGRPGRAARMTLPRYRRYFRHQRKRNETKKNCGTGGTRRRRHAGTRRRRRQHRDSAAAATQELRGGKPETQVSFSGTLLPIIIPVTSPSPASPAPACARRPL